MKDYYATHSYLELNDVLSRLDPLTRPIGLIVSTRGGGKTSHTLVWVLNQYLEHGYKTIWTRTYGTDMTRSRLKDFLEVNLLAPVREGKLRITGNRHPKLTMVFGKEIAYATCDGVPFITFLPLNITRIAGSTVADTKYRIIVVDEFLVDPRKGERELKDVVSSFAHIAQTVFRTRPYRAILLGNPYTTASQWFDWLGVDWKKVKVNRVSAPKGKPYALLWLVGSKHSGEMKKSTFGVMFGNATVSKSSIEGQFFEDNDSLIVDKGSYIKSDCVINFKGPDGAFGVWYDRKSGYLVVSPTLGQGQPVIVPDENDSDGRSYLMATLRGTPFALRLRRARMSGMLRFENQSVMQLAIGILDRALV